MKDRLAILLMLKILEMLKSSGANYTEAACALNAAIALLPEAGLETKPMMTFSG
jgi:hypothetical protein